MLKRTISMAIAIIMALGLIAMHSAPVAAAGVFNDLPEKHWAYNYIKELADLDIIGGYPDGTYRPDGKVTVAECIALVLRTFYRLRGQEADFPPTTEHWASGYIEYARGNGFFFMRDLNEGQIIDDPATRLQMAMFIDRALGFFGVKYSSLAFYHGSYEMMYSSQPLYGYEYRFSDVVKAYQNEEISSDGVTAITHLYMIGIVNGYADGTFGVNDTISRAETATIIYRTLNWETLEYGEYPPQPEPPTPAVVITGTPSITLAVDKITMNPGETYQMKATVTGIQEGTYYLLWANPQNKDIVSVDENGLLTAHITTYNDYPQHLTVMILDKNTNKAVIIENVETYADFEVIVNPSNDPIFNPYKNPIDIPAIQADIKAYAESKGFRWDDTLYPMYLWDKGKQGGRGMMEGGVGYTHLIDVQTNSFGHNHEKMRHNFIFMVDSLLETIKTENARNDLGNTYIGSTYLYFDPWGDGSNYTVYLLG